MDSSVEGRSGYDEIDEGDNYVESNVYWFFVLLIGRLSEGDIEVVGNKIWWVSDDKGNGGVVVEGFDDGREEWVEIVGCKV